MICNCDWLPTYRCHVIHIQSKLSTLPANKNFFSCFCENQLLESKLSWVYQLFTEMTQSESYVNKAYAIYHKIIVL